MKKTIIIGILVMLLAAACTAASGKNGEVLVYSAPT